MPIAYDDMVKSHRMYDVRKSTYPEGAHLILSHRSAKLLRESDPSFEITSRKAVYHNVNGRMVKEYTNRHRRNSHKHGILDKIAGCCADSGCMMALCAARP